MCERPSSTKIERKRGVPAEPPVRVVVRERPAVDVIEDKQGERSGGRETKTEKSVGLLLEGSDELQGGSLLPCFKSRVGGVQVHERHKGRRDEEN